MDRLLWYVFAGSRGGATRVRIVRLLLVRPRNANQVARELGMDYKTILYNLRVLEKHVYVVSEDAHYGRRYAPSKNLMAARDHFDAIAARVPEAPLKDAGKTTNTQGGE